MTAAAERVIWLTRPRFQVEALKARLETAGARVEHLPMFEIRPLDYSQAIRNTVLQLDQYELVFFISTNAAKLGLDCFLHFWPQLPVGQHYFAVGPSTAEVLEQEGLLVHYPRERMSSEALLAIPELAAIDGKNALICRGVGGRETLAQGLRDKGARVTYLELYERAVPDYPQAQVEQLIATGQPDAIVVTSSEALVNLEKVLGSLWPPLYDSPLLVSSERIAEDARNSGFQQITTMTGASDPCIMAAIDSLPTTR